MPARKFIETRLLKVYLEREEHDLLLKEARDKGTTLSDYAREVLVGRIAGKKEKLPRGARVRVVRRGAGVRRGYIEQGRDSGEAETVQETSGGRDAENSLGTPHSEEFVPLALADDSTWKPGGAAEPSGNYFDKPEHDRTCQCGICAFKRSMKGA